MQDDVEQPDLQGPMDNLELLWGSELFYALYDLPDEIHALLDKLAGKAKHEKLEMPLLFVERESVRNLARGQDSEKLGLQSLV